MDTLSTHIELLYGQAQTLVYDKLKDISTAYMCAGGCPSPEISEADLCGAYLSGVESASILKEDDKFLDMLIVLNNLLTNGSNITW